LSAWINGRRAAAIDHRDRGLHYGDGLFETMRVRHRAIRLLDYHLERLYDGCRRLAIAAPPEPVVRRELVRIAAQRPAGILKLIVTRGSGARGYRPSGRERCTRIAALYPLPARAVAAASNSVRVRLCATHLGGNPALAGMKSLNRLESVLARAEWSDARIWEGLMRDADENIVCGTMSNLFLRRGSILLTPVLDRCGVAGVMRRWVLEQARALRLRAVERRIRWEDLGDAAEVFMSNAVVGLKSVGEIRHHEQRIRPPERTTAAQLRARLDLL